MVFDNDQFQIRIEGIRQRFIRSLGNVSCLITKLERRIADKALREDALSELRYHAHKIRGAAPTLGFLELGVQAAKIEDLIDLARSGIMSQNVLEEILTALTQLKIECDVLQVSSQV